MFTAGYGLGVYMKLKFMLGFKCLIKRLFVNVPLHSVFFTFSFMSCLTPSPVLHCRKYNHAWTNSTSGDIRANERRFTQILTVQMTTPGCIISEISIVINYLYSFHRKYEGQRSVTYKRPELRSTWQSKPPVIAAQSQSALGHRCIVLPRP